MTVSLLCGIERVRFLRLWRRAPRTTISPKLVCAFNRIERRMPGGDEKFYFSNRPRERRTGAQHGAPQPTGIRVAVKRGYETDLRADQERADSDYARLANAGARARASFGAAP